MVTANNGRFLGYLDGTPQAEAIRSRHAQLTTSWKAHPRVGPVFTKLLDEHRNFESVVEPLKATFDWRRDLGLRKGEVYRIVPSNLVAIESDFAKAFDFRRSQLEDLWEDSRVLSHPFEVLRQEEQGKFCGISPPCSDNLCRSASLCQIFTFGQARIIATRTTRHGSQPYTLDLSGREHGFLIARATPMAIGGSTWSSCSSTGPRER